MTNQTDHTFQDLMKMSRLEINDPAFEEMVMLAVESEELKSSAKRDLTFSWLFFGAGTLFGFILSILIPQMPVSESWIDSDTLTMGFQILFALFVLIHLDTLIRMTRDMLKPVSEY